LAVLFCYLDLTKVLSFCQPTAGEKGGFYLAALFCYLDITGVLASPQKRKRGGFYLAVLFCYLDLTEVLVSPQQGKTGGFYLAACCFATWILLEFWPAHKGEKRRFLPGNAVLLPGPY
jgi:hypothetical protein